MPAAAVEAPVGSHQVLATKKYVLMNGDQPDDDQKNEAHGSRPPEFRTRPSPLSQCVESLGLRQWRMKRRESTIAFRECKRVLAAFMNPIETASLENARTASCENLCRDALTNFSILSNIRPVSGGSRGNVKDLAMFRRNTSQTRRARRARRRRADSIFTPR